LRDDFGLETVSFEYHESIHLTTVEPSYGSDKGGTVVFVSGKHFLNSHGLLCRFGNSVPTPGRHVSENAIECTSPVGRPGQVLLSITNNGVDYSDTSIVFRYMPSAKVVQFSPNRGPQVGGSTIKVLGTGFSTSGCKCHFGKRVVVAIVRNSTFLECVSPPAQNVQINYGAVAFDISNSIENVHRTYSDKTFTYEPSATISNIIPSVVKASGTAAIQVIGQSFPTKGTNMSCVFQSGDFKFNSIADVRSSTLILCQTPNVTKYSLSSLSVRIAEGGIPITTSGIRLGLYDGFVVSHIEPLHGADEGGSIVSIYLFDNKHPSSATILCRFGENAVVPAFYSTKSVVKCVSPHHPVGLAQLSLSMNSVDFDDLGVSFRFTTKHTLSFIEPSSGPSAGGSTVYIYGTGFLNTSELSCRFGNKNIPVTATFVSSTSIYCLTPCLSSQGSQTVSIEVSNNGHEWSSSFLTFKFYRSVLLSGIIPSRGALTGGTRSRLIGSGFNAIIENDKTSVVCHYGENEVNGTIISDSEIVCESPAVDKPGPASMSLSKHGQTINSGTPLFTYRRDSSLVSVLPDYASELGGAAITIFLDGTAVQSDTVFCRFGELNIAATDILMTS
jgi:hypothetical protein